MSRSLHGDSARLVAGSAPIQGQLQALVMTTLWRLGTGTVEEVRQGLPSRHRGAYTTVQTVLNRLAERHLLERRREGRNLVYRPRFSEAEYLSRAIRHTLAGASVPARRAVLAELIGGLAEDELGELQRLAQEVGRARGARTS